MLPIFNVTANNMAPSGARPQFSPSFTSTLANAGAGIAPPPVADEQVVYQCSGCGTELHSHQAMWEHKTQCKRFIENAQRNGTVAPDLIGQMQHSTAIPNMPSMSQSQQTQPAVQYLNDEGWIVQWFNEDKQRIWKIGVPQFKYCKKRKDHYSSSFPDVWYKAPYKYNMSLDVMNLTMEENMMAYIDMNYEDGQKVVMYQNGSGKKSPSALPINPGGKSGVISNNESHFVHSMDSQVSAGSGKPPVGNVTIGPFQFNICSYKQDGRKFRMVIYIYSPDTSNILSVGAPAQGPQLCCCLISPSFTIRAKKPIVKPGIKGKKGEEAAAAAEEGAKDKKKRGKGKRKSDAMASEDESDHEDSNDGTAIGGGHDNHHIVDQMNNEPQNKRTRLDDQDQLDLNHPPAFPMMNMPQHLPQQPLKKRMGSAGKSPMPMRNLTPNNGELSFLQLSDENQTPQFVDRDELANTMNSLPSHHQSGVASSSSTATPSSSSEQSSSNRSNNSNNSSGIDMGLEKVYSIVQTFKLMNDNDRKQLLCRLIEFTMPHEKEFIYHKYFSGEAMDQQQQQQQQQINTPNQPMPFMNNYMSAYQYQMIRQQQQELLDYFTSMQQQEDFAQQQMMNNQMFSNMMMQNSAPMNNNYMMQQQQQQQQQQPSGSNTPGSSTANNSAGVYVPPSVISGQASDVDQFFVELFDS